MKADARDFIFLPAMYCPQCYAQLEPVLGNGVVSVPGHNCNGVEVRACEINADQLMRTMVVSYD